ncbi:lysophospholipid acyltransferase family protein [Desulfurobacterium atlanticum]|uniref:1-acyl-sn-glycerol-3-phosphate acyltransferase n=1 Tax=Desulfurobacterium atlanticum TaxID=240169 RepID=A0A239AC31_9BACT|nr:lysophospholipid acyltransferase family protein [Desulfurobacterium atlanticum]SNR93216.1 1-acyl-sn-glycerol-3-phosphate acyltransferase [Desulfurobacterium atlanticum]
MEPITKTYPWLKRKKAYYIWLKTAGAAIAKLAHLEVEGRNNIPLKGPVLLVSNHRSFMDPPLVAYAVMKRPVFFMAKAELFETPFISTLIKHWGNGFPVRRGKFDLKAIKTALTVLKKGELLCLFPEGTRAQKGKFLKPKIGAGMIAVKANVPLIPCLIDGSEDLLPKGAKFPRMAHVKIKFGKPFTIELEDTKENYEKASRIIMEKIKELQVENNSC